MIFCFVGTGQRPVPTPGRTVIASGGY